MPLHFGLGLFTGQVPPNASRTIADEYADTLALARVADEVGFDAFWVSEHHFAADSYLPSLLVMLAAVAAVTERIELGTAMVLAPFQQPLRFAEDCAVLDHLARGRLLVGLGAGWREAEFRAFGIPMRERVGRTVELAQVCRLAWDQERFSFHGKYFDFDDVALTPRPAGHLRLLLGGNVPAAIARAGRLADGYIGSPQNRLSVFQEQVAAFDEAARAAGRDPSRLAIGFHVNAWVSPDGSLPASVQHAMWHQIGTYAVWHAEDKAQGEPDAGLRLPPLDERLIRERTLLGTPAEVVAQTRPWVEAFPNDRELHVVVRLHYPGMARAEAEAAIRLFAAEVIPAFRGLAST